MSRDYEAMSNDGGGIVTKRNVEFLRQICTSVDELIKPKAALVTLAKNMILRQSYGATNNLMGLVIAALSNWQTKKIFQVYVFIIMWNCRFIKQKHWLLVHC